MAPWPPPRGRPAPTFGPYGLMATPLIKQNTFRAEFKETLLNAAVTRAELKAKKRVFLFVLMRLELGRQAGGAALGETEGEQKGNKGGSKPAHVERPPPPLLICPCRCGREAVEIPHASS